MNGRLRSTMVALSSVLVIVGMSVGILLMPWFTAVFVPASGAYELTGLSDKATRDVAEEVRYFVSHRDAPALPAEIDGQQAFDESAVSHLVDVRDVVLAARWVTVIALVGLCVLVAHAVAHSAQFALARGFKWAGRALLAVLAIAGLAGVIEFDALFAGFHALFFAAGTWVFPYDALLIRIFPLPFWTIGGAALALLVAVGAVGFIVAGRTVGNLSSASTSD
ncbi:MAG: lipoprotein intramolecular transacylase Lit [Coriobacteriia bacterium]